MIEKLMAEMQQIMKNQIAIMTALSAKTGTAHFEENIKETSKLIEK